MKYDSQNGVNTSRLLPSVLDEANGVPQLKYLLRPDMFVLHSLMTVKL